MKGIHRFPALVFALLMLVTHAWPARAEGKADTPEACVASFYAWFFQHDDDQTYPLREPTIYRFVAKKTIDRLRQVYQSSGPPEDVDYFLKVQDYDSQDWARHTSVHTPVRLGEVAIVPVTFGMKEPSGVLVFLRKEEGRWKIIKIDDTWAYD